MNPRLPAVLAVAIVSSGCFQMTTVMKVKGDGSGTIDHRMLFTRQALAQLKQFAALGGSGRQAIDPTSEQQAQEMAATLGPGVSYVSSQPVSTPAGEGRDAVYAFTDVGRLRVSTQPAPPGGAAIQAGGLSTIGDTLTFSITHEPNGNAVVHINVPEPSLVNSLSTNAAPQQMAMIKSLLAGAHVSLAVEPDGTLVRTNSAYAEGPRVTLLDVDLDQVLKDDTLAERLQAARTPEELKTLLKGVPGLKLTLEKEITIEFTPRP